MMHGNSNIKLKSLINIYVLNLLVKMSHNSTAYKYLLYAIARSEITNNYEMPCPRVLFITVAIE